MKNSTKFILVFVFLFAVISHNQYGFAQSSNVTLVGHISDGSNLTYQNLTKFGNSVYIVERNVMWSGGVGAYNVSNPTNPQMINFNYRGVL